MSIELRSSIAPISAYSPFAPHERARSSRHRYVDALRLRYGLPTP